MSSLLPPQIGLHIISVGSAKNPSVLQSTVTWAVLWHCATNDHSAAAAILASCFPTATCVLQAGAYCKLAICCYRWLLLCCSLVRPMCTTHKQTCHAQTRRSAPNAIHSRSGNADNVTPHLLPRQKKLCKIEKCVRKSRQPVDMYELSFPKKPLELAFLFQYQR